jgi:hypothetical protein
MSKMVLTIEEDYDFTLIGISCHSKDYRLCWELNKMLNTDLIRTKDYDINKKNGKSSFSFYEFIDESNYLEYFFISNRGKSGFLIPEQNNVDFFILIRGSTSDSLTKEIIGKINSLSLVLTSFNIDPTQLRSKQNLLF